MEINEKPLINVIQLSKYQHALTDNKKIKILMNLKFPNNFNYGRYKIPKNSIFTYLKDQTNYEKIFKEKIDEYALKKPESNFGKSDKKCSIEVLEILNKNALKLYGAYNDLYPKKLNEKGITHLQILDLDINLSPDCILMCKQTNEIKGFIKHCFQKTVSGRLTIADGHIITGLIKEHLEKTFNIILEQKYCIAIDVFSARAIRASDEQKWLGDKNKLSGTYKEICELWPLLNKAEK